MKKLLNTLYVTTPDAYLSLDGENVVVRLKDNEIGRVPIHNLENIVTFGWQGASPALMRHICESGKGLSFFSSGGRFLCRVEGEERGNVLLRREQYRIADDERRSLPVAVNMIGAKTTNARTVLNRFLRDHPLSSDGEAIRAAADYLRDSLPAIRSATDTDTLRGLEGVNACKVQVRSNLNRYRCSSVCRPRCVLRAGSCRSARNNAVYRRLFRIFRSLLLWS